MDDIQKTIIENMIFYREKRGLKTKELDEAIGVKDNTVSTWESGKNAPNLQSLYKICTALDISISDLFGKYSNEKNKLELKQLEQENIKLKEENKKEKDANELLLKFMEMKNKQDEEARKNVNKFIEEVKSKVVKSMQKINEIRKKDNTV